MSEHKSEGARRTATVHGQDVFWKRCVGGAACWWKMTFLGWVHREDGRPG